MVLLALTSGTAHAEQQEMVIAAGTGITMVDKNIPFNKTSTTAAFSAAVGYRLSDRSAASGRADLVLFDGVDVQLSLAVEHDIGRHLGVFGMAGIAAGDISRVGATFGFGGYARLGLGRGAWLRLELLTQQTKRSDFTGGRHAAALAVEYRLR